MHYKTIILELLESRPRLKTQLQQERAMLATVESWAEALKASHEAWKTRLTHTQPASGALQIASEALELALTELTARLPSESEAEDATFSLDPAMAFGLHRSSEG